MDGYLGMILGAATAALKLSGYDRARIHQMIDAALNAQELAGRDPRLRQAGDLLTEAAVDMMMPPDPL